MSFSAFSMLTFCGAVAIFIYGIRLTRSGVQLLAGDRLRVVISHLTENRLLAVGVGALVTLILQSSNATTITLVGIAASGTITLTQAMGVVLGAGIGTTVVIVLLAIEEIARYSLLLLVIGILIDIVRQGKRARYASMIFMGAGFIFFGMRLMIQVTEPLQAEPLLQELFLHMANNPVMVLLATMIFTMLVQNSATPIGLAIALSFSGLLDLPAALPIVLGANVGTSSGSLIASLGSNTVGKRVAVSNLLIKTTGAALILLLIQPFTDFIRWTTEFAFAALPTSGQIAAAHIFFNLFLVIVFLPLLRPAAWLIEKMIREPRRAEDEKFQARYLDKKSLDIPSLAFANVRREILRMLDLDTEMFRDCRTVLDKNDRILMEAIQSQDDQVDLLDREIKFYLAKLSQEDLTAEQGEMELHLIAMTSKLEEIGDVINRSILELADKKIRKGRKFSAEGWEEILEFHKKILENFKLAAASLATEDEALAKRLVRHHEQLGKIENENRQGHLKRLHEGRKETLETSSIHLDLLSSLYRIDELLTQLIQENYPNL